MPEDDEAASLHFDVHPSVVFHLGESLITDVVQALIELVKNSYDADATYSRVIINTHNRANDEGSLFPSAQGYVLIEDNGTGMDLNTIQSGWLTAANSAKRDLKRRRGITPGHHRTPLGDKGLGRLGAQRLGYNLEIITRPAKGDKEYHVGFSWKDFLTAQKLSDVKIQSRIRPAEGAKGTKLIISDMRDPAAWEGEATDRLRRSLSQVISPYADISKFKVVLAVNGARVELAEIGEQVRQTAKLRYRVDFDSSTFNAHGRVRLSYFRPQSKAEKEDFRQLVEDDGGERFYQFLSKRTAAGRFCLRRSKDPDWFVEFRFERLFRDFDSLSLDEGKLANPGPFFGEVDGFDLGRESAREQSVFDSDAAYKGYIQDFSGIRVYRDGFGVRVDRDWLHLASGWTSAPSYYGLKPENTLGYISISARENGVLEETTDREGFKVTPHYLNFYEMLQQFIQFTDQAQEFLRRSWVAFRGENDAAIQPAERHVSTKELATRLRTGLSQARSHRSLLKNMATALGDAVRDAGKSMDAVRAALKPSSKEYKETIIALQALNQQLDAAQAVIAKTEEYLEEVGNLQSTSALLNQRMEALQERVEQTIETVSLGITAEALSHEIHNVADQLADRTDHVYSYMKRLKDAKVFEYLEYVRTSVGGLRKQLAHLAPALKYVRENREPVNLPNFLASVVDFRRERFQQRSIELQTDGDEAFRIRINPGKLSQIFDNLLLNSEYWVGEHVRKKEIDAGVIRIELRKPFVRISDNGPGVDVSLENSIFEPFVSGKARGKGRGLGLFVVQQLLDSEGCSISLLPVRNEVGRRCVFQIDFRGALNDK